MPEPAINIVTAIANAISAVFNYLTGRSNAKQAADIKAAEVAKQDQAAQDKLNDAIERRDIDEIRKAISE